MLKNLFRWWGQGDRASTARDSLAGLSLACMNIPQVLGYARIAGMPAVTGLYTVLLPLVAFAGVGSSRHLVVAADSATAAIFSSALARMAPPGSAHYMALVSMVALLSAGFLLAARLFRLGFLADFLSRTVLVGFMAGVGLQVGIAMTYDMLGLQATAHNPFLQFVELLKALPHLAPLSAAISLVMCLFLYAGEKFAPHKPLALVLVAGSIFASWAMGLEARGVALVGPLSGGLPSLHFPRVGWNDMLSLLPVATSCVFVIIAQSAATSRTYAYKFQEDVDANRDILGLSAANAMAALSGTFTVNGSPTQTAMAVQAGARSQKAQLVFACVTLVVLLFLTGPLHYLPRCVLGAIVFSVAMGMIDLRALWRIRQESPGEFGLALITATTVVGVGVEQGILVAIALSLFRHVRHSYEPHTMVLQEDAQTKLLEASPVKAGVETEPGLIVYRFCADLFYANCNRFADDIRFLIKTAPTPVRCIVVDASAITDIDYSAASLLRTVLQELQAKSVLIAFGRVNPFLRADMDRHRISAVLGESNIYAQLHTAVAAARSHARCEKA
ncbi:SulP family inorganic anion transporter [Acetobacter cerevisiae]|uniref:Transporter n=1 Tax=Acetobacter cerevisiae TaxID=178900 RepID=A0A149UWR1_9PROT|nr:SulP family inorganic anion transporter [Acetobacter cerevisiae]KXV72378.1 transporter [Acetobacter cerevisiae]MCP1244732.1 SulP family inorganic anion transporter [Acetobacter cerevisiae]MCP1254309.1 SulP family inorganic anion transporter [Acetobacter cerevisiae]